MVVGDHDRTDASDGQVYIRAASWTPHPNYNSATNDYDFALIKLSSSLTFSNTVMPACLPSTTTNYDAVTAVVTGEWNYLNLQGVPRRILDSTGCHKKMD